MPAEIQTDIRRTPVDPGLGVCGSPREVAQRSVRARPAAATTRGASSRFMGGGHRRSTGSSTSAGQAEHPGEGATISTTRTDGRIAHCTTPTAKRSPRAQRAGRRLPSSRAPPASPGNALPLRVIRSATIHNVGKRATAARWSARRGRRVMAKEGEQQVRLPSGEVREVHIEVHATIGRSAAWSTGISIGEAGHSRWDGLEAAQPQRRMTYIDPRWAADQERPAAHPTPWGKTKGVGATTSGRTASSSTGTVEGIKRSMSRSIRRAHSWTSISRRRWR